MGQLVLWARTTTRGTLFQRHKRRRAKARLYNGKDSKELRKADNRLLCDCTIEATRRAELFCFCFCCPTTQVNQLFIAFALPFLLACSIFLARQQDTSYSLVIVEVLSSNFSGLILETWMGASTHSRLGSSSASR
jgi:hypothetical protein